MSNPNFLLRSNEDGALLQLLKAKAILQGLDFTNQAAAPAPTPSASSTNMAGLGSFTNTSNPLLCALLANPSNRRNVTLSHVASLPKMNNSFTTSSRSSTTTTGGNRNNSNSIVNSEAVLSLLIKVAQEQAAAPASVTPTPSLGGTRDSPGSLSPSVSLHLPMTLTAAPPKKKRARKTPKQKVVVAPRMDKVSDVIRRQTLERKHKQEGYAAAAAAAAPVAKKQRLRKPAPAALSTQISNSQVQFPLPSSNCNSPPKRAPALQTFQTQWKTLDQHVKPANHCFPTQAQRDQFVRELFARNLNKTI